MRDASVFDFARFQIVRKIQRVCEFAEKRGLRARVVDPARKWLYYGGKLSFEAALQIHSRLAPDRVLDAHLRQGRRVERLALCNPTALETVLGQAPAG